MPLVAVRPHPSAPGRCPGRMSGCRGLIEPGQQAGALWMSSAGVIHAAYGAVSLSEDSCHAEFMDMSVDADVFECGEHEVGLPYVDPN